MNNPIAAASHAVICVDHHHAIVLQIDAGLARPRHVHAHAHPTARHGSDVRSAHDLFAEVCASVETIGSILLTGGNAALIDFEHYVDKHQPRTAERIAAYYIVDHPTENQLRALGRQFFEL